MAGGRPGTCRLDQLKVQRLLAGWSISQLARAVNIGDLTIVQLEAGGNIENAKAAEIATVLGVSLPTLGQALL